MVLKGLLDQDFILWELRSAEPPAIQPKLPPLFSPVIPTGVDRAATRALQEFKSALERSQTHAHQQRLLAVNLISDLPNAADHIFEARYVIETTRPYWSDGTTWRDAMGTAI